MWKNRFTQSRSRFNEYEINDFKALLRYINYLASNKLGYPVSLLTYLGVLNNKILGINPGSIANVLLNNVGDPFKDSETSLLEVKKHEREIITILEKFYGLGTNEARGYVTTGGTEGNFAALWWSKRFLINSLIDSLTATDDVIKLQTKEEQALVVALNRIPTTDTAARMEQLQKILDLKNAMAENKNVIQQLLTPTVFYSKGHTHYSIPKIAEILRLNIKPVLANADGSIDLDNLKKELFFHVQAHPHSAAIVIANIGTTIMGAIDDVPGIKVILDSFKGLKYTIHMDGALTGFVLPVIRPFGEVANYFDALGVNTLAVSAHKYPGLSQPCGIILAKRDFFEKAFERAERSIEYVGNIVDVTITGSRSGLNVLMLYHALCTLGLDKNHETLTAMVKENLENGRYLYENLVAIFGKDKVSYPFHFNVIFPRPSQTLAKKYQLMLTGDKATICVLTNVSKKLINQFIEDLKLDKENEMSNTTLQTEYTIQTLQHEHLKSTVELFTKTFCDSEPITKHLNIHYQDYEKFATEVVHKAINDGMSKVALDKHNRVVACVIAEDIADPFIAKLQHYPRLKPIVGILHELSKPFLQGKTFVKGKIAHVWIAAVDQAARGKGLSTSIDMACGEMAARKGYDFVYAEFTNDISEKIVNQYNLYQLINKIKYEDYVLEGQKPFQGVKGSAASYIVVIRPGVKLDTLSHCYTMEKA